MFPTLPVPDRFALIIAGLCRVVAAHIARDRAAGPLIVLIWKRLQRAATRFAAFAAQARAGTIPAVRVRARREAVRATRSPHHLPHGAAWLVRLMQETAVFGSQLRHLLDDPEMATLIAADPRMGRLLRPLCRMLGVAPVPEMLRLSRTARTSRAPKPQVPEPGSPEPSAPGPSSSRPVSVDPPWWFRRPDVPLPFDPTASGPVLRTRG